jgi:beta-N-acetylhexosaminidase
VNAYLCCGVAGSELSGEEREALRRLEPGGVILFARNVADRYQLAALVAELHALPGRPYVAVDLEGGRVNRLRGVLGELPSAAQAGQAGVAAVAALGRAAGAACASLGIDVDLAPVVDVARHGGWLGAEGRCFASEPAGVAALAAVFAEAVESYGVGVCLKHYPGLGSGGVDSHQALPLLGEEVAQEARVFARLSSERRAVMVAHALAPALGEAFAPASLSRRVVATLRRTHGGPVLADDVEMGALASYGSLPERAAAALAAGCDQVLVCNALEQRSEVVAYVQRWRRREPALDSALRAGAARLARFARVTPPAVPWGVVEELWERARYLAAAGATGNARAFGDGVTET